MTRSHPGQPRPYTGVVNIVSGEVAEDLATYLVGVGCSFMRGILVVPFGCTGFRQPVT